MLKRILVVEDESLVAMLVEDMLLDMGFDVVGPAWTLDQAMSFARDGDFDFALLDVNLGEGATSFGAAELLRDRQVPFAFLTGYGVQGVRADLRDAPVLSKPIDPRKLERMLATIGWD